MATYTLLNSLVNLPTSIQEQEVNHCLFEGKGKELLGLSLIIHPTSSNQTKPCWKKRVTFGTIRHAHIPYTLILLSAAAVPAGLGHKQQPSFRPWNCTVNS